MTKEQIIAAYGHPLANTGGHDPAELLERLTADGTR